MGLPIIVREDFFRRTDLTGHSVPDPGSLTGFSFTRLADDKDYLAWRPSTIADKSYAVDLGAGNTIEANVVAILGHTLFTETASVTVSHSDTAITGPFTDVVGPFAPSNNRIIVRTFESAGAHRFWRVLFSSIDSTSLQVSEVFLGRRIEFPFGIEWRGFDPLEEMPVNRAVRTEQGHVIKVTSDFSRRLGSWEFRFLPDSFVGDETLFIGFKDWWDTVGSKGLPSVFHWNPGSPGSFEQDGVWAIVRGTMGRPLATQIDSGFRNVSFDFEGLKED